MKNLLRQLTSPSPLLPTAIALGTLVAALGLLLFGRDRGHAAAEPAGAPPQTTLSTAAGPAASPSAVRQWLAPETRAGLPGLPPEARAADSPLAPDELKAALERLAAVPMTDGPALETALRPLLSSSTLDTILARLVRDDLGDVPRNPPEIDVPMDAVATPGRAEIGGVRALVFALLLFADPAAPPPALSALAGEVDGARLLEQTLTTLPHLRPALREALVELLRQARGPGERPLIDLSHVALLERLIAEHPDLAELLRGLLADLAQGLDPELARAQDLWTLVVEDSPRLLSAALARLLRSDPEHALAWADELFTREDLSHGLVRAVTATVAATAPVEPAVDFLLRHPADDLHAEYYTLGTRAGGLEALQGEYEERRLVNADPAGRTALLTGLGEAPAEYLLGVAVSDPDGGVRGQAWMTSTLARDFRPRAGTVDLLEATVTQRDHPELGAPDYALVSAASNMARRAAREAPELLPRLIQVLRGLAADPTVHASARANALQQLSAYLTASELAELRG